MPRPLVRAFRRRSATRMPGQSVGIWRSDAAAADCLSRVAGFSTKLRHIPRPASSWSRPVPLEIHFAPRFLAKVPETIRGSTLAHRVMFASFRGLTC